MPDCKSGGVTRKLRILVENQWDMMRMKMKLQLHIPLKHVECKGSCNTRSQPSTIE